MSASLLLIEDDQTLGEGLRKDLVEAGYTCHHVLTAGEGLKALDEQPVSLVLLDVMLPDMDGFAALKRIRASWSLPVILLTAVNSGPDKVSGLALGADDYITKPFWLEEVVARIEAVLRRAGPMKAATRWKLGDLEVDSVARAVQLDGVLVKLTPTELELLCALLRQQGEAVPREQLIQAHLAGVSNGLQALQTHMSRLKRKLKGGYVHTVWGVGYRVSA